MAAVDTAHRDHALPPDLPLPESPSRHGHTLDSLPQALPTMHCPPSEGAPMPVPAPVLAEATVLHGLHIAIPVAQDVPPPAPVLPRASLRDNSILPSDPRFDRSHLSPEEYIELLLYEIAELKADLDSRDRTIARLSADIHKPGAYGEPAEAHPCLRSAQRAAALASLDPRLHHARKSSGASHMLYSRAVSLSSPLEECSSIRSSRPGSRPQSLSRAYSSAIHSVHSNGDALKPGKVTPPATFDASEPVCPDRDAALSPDPAYTPALHVLQVLSPDSGSSGSLYEDILPPPEQPVFPDASTGPAHHNTRGYGDEPPVGAPDGELPANMLASPAIIGSTPYYSGRVSVPTGSNAVTKSPIGFQFTAAPNLPRGYMPDGRNLSPPSSQLRVNSSYSLSSEAQSSTLSNSTTNLRSLESSDTLSRTKPSVQTPGSSFSVRLPTETDVSLLVKPEEFHTVTVLVVSTIFIPSSANPSAPPRRAEEPTCTIAIKDRQSQKEMWRVRKTLTQIHEFSSETRYIVEYFKLPDLPERALFHSSSPAKVNLRLSQLQAYFSALFAMPHIPQLVLYKVCRFISLDLVSPLDDYKSGALQEGFLIRKYKSLVSSWKTKWCQVDGPLLEIYDSPGGQLVEQIQLAGCQVGKQLAGSAGDERGARNAFIILEPSKGVRALIKHVFCAETAAARDEWIAALLAQAGVDQIADFGTADAADISALSPSQSSFGAYSVAGHGTHNRSYVDDSFLLTKETRKGRMKSYFPFRSANKSVEPEADCSFDSKNSADDSIALSSSGHILGLEEEAPRNVFGRSIAEARGLSSHFLYEHEVPSILFRCIDYLTQVGAVHEEGIFRLSGLANSIRQLKIEFDTHFDLDLAVHPLSPDMHTVAGLLKLYLRELKQPILGPVVSKRLAEIIQSHDKSRLPGRLAHEFRLFIEQPGNMDAAEYDATFAVCKFLTIVLAQQLHNLMNLRNLCIVFVPTLNIPVEGLCMLLEDFSFIFEKGQLVPDCDRAVVDVHIPLF